MSTPVECGRTTTMMADDLGERCLASTSGRSETALRLMQLIYG